MTTQSEAIAQIEAARSSMIDWNAGAWENHPALGYICDYRDGCGADVESLKEMAKLIDTAYPDLCYGEDGGVCGQGAAELIVSCYTAFNHADANDAAVLLEAGFMSKDEHDDYIADLDTL